MSLSSLFQIPQYLVFWLLSCDHIISWDPIEFWKFRFQLHFLVHVHTKTFPYWILASCKSVNIHILLWDMKYSLISCTAHPTNGTHQFCQYYTWCIINLYRLFLGTTYQSLGASFQVTFSHPSLCVVLILVLHISGELPVC